MRVRYTGRREEVVEAGDAYHMSPGHTPIVEAGTGIVEFSRQDEYQEIMEVAGRNFEAMQQQA